MPARYPPIDRLPPLQVRIAEDGDGRIAERMEVEEARTSRRRSGGRRAADGPQKPLAQPLEGRLAGLDAFRGAALLLFAWAVLLPVPLVELLGGVASEASDPWRGPGAALVDGSFRGNASLNFWREGVGTWFPWVLVAAACLAAGAGVPLAAARRSRAGGGRLELALSLPLRLATLVLLAILVPVMRPEGAGASPALCLLGLLGLVPLTVRFGPGVTRAGRWTLRAGGLGICLAVLWLRIGVPETAASAWEPDPVVLAIALSTTAAALLWLAIPGANPLVWTARLFLGLAVAVWVIWLPPLLDLAAVTLPLPGWLGPWTLLGTSLAIAGTIAGDLGVRHLRDTAPAPPGALPREETEAVRWGGGGVMLMALLLMSAPIAGLALAGGVAEAVRNVPFAAEFPQMGVAAVLALLPAALARGLMVGNADASGRWARSLATLSLVLLVLAVLCGVGLAAVGEGLMQGRGEAPLALARGMLDILATLLGLAGGLGCLLAAATVLLDRPAPVIPLGVALPLTGVGRNPLLLYAILAGPVLVLFGSPWLPVAPAGGGWASIDAWAAHLIVSLWGPDASPIHGVGYALAKVVVIGLPVALLARAGVVLRA